MSIAPTEGSQFETTAIEPSSMPDRTPAKGRRPEQTSLRRSASRVKCVPVSFEQRVEIRAAAEQFADGLDKRKPFNRSHLERWSHELLEQLDLPEHFLGFAAVTISNAFWKHQFLAVPFERRMLLLPHCLKHADGCPATYSQFGLDCETCGACSIADYKVRAEQLGYKVLVAEGSPVVLKIIVSGYIDGVLGVACLNVLEKAIDKVLLAGAPSYAIPLHSGNCKNTSLDESWVWEVLDKYEPHGGLQTASYLPLMRVANHLFDMEFERLVPAVRAKESNRNGSLIARTETIAYDWLENGGKRFRPFITLAAYEALTESSRLSVTRSNEAPRSYPDAVCRVAIAIEAFHKASLVHDDIEDDDLYRYGRKTLHRQYGLGTAINVGDYLIGLGYRLLNSASQELGPNVACDILGRMATAHVKLCDGQGAEMAWQSAPNLNLTPLDALQIYALKTAPAFEAALYAGLRMAGPVDLYEQLIPAFSRHLGVGFQILNDLKDWQGDDNNKLIAGQDAACRRPTILLAMALQAADAQQRSELEKLLTDDEQDDLRVERLRHLFEQCGVFCKAKALVEKSRARAETLANSVELNELRQLLCFLVDTVLSSEEARQSDAIPNLGVSIACPPHELDMS